VARQSPERSVSPITGADDPPSRGGLSPAAERDRKNPSDVVISINSTPS
jgi:hypothetical protein